ncbi:Transcriptional regulatory protein ZraR [Burkholderiales bacterium]|nr:Transcriptional regulatory protein ZraR [Burkholderiales bacterium]
MNPPTLPGLTSDADAKSLAANTLLRLFDSLYEGALVIDRAGRITWINDKYRALLGWNGTDPIEGRPVEEVIPHSRLREVMETGRAELIDVLSLGARQVVVSRIPLANDAGEIIGALGVILYDRVQALKPIVSKVQHLQTELAHARKELAETRQAKYRFSQIVGVSAAMREVKEHGRRAAERDATVLLLGETGTGKELMAHAIHAASKRQAKPLVSLNAAAIPENLLEAELFGVEPGAYTGAGNKPRPGKFQLADGGTLFLDEVGDMPLTLQAKLLRVLQEGEVEPVGSNRLKSIDVRVIAATSRDLKGMVASGAFRADLFYRLNVLPIRLAPLRERSEDLPALCEALLEQLAARGNEPLRSVSGAGLARLMAYHWPGNVRELSNALQLAAARFDTRVFGPEHFADLPQTAPAEGAILAPEPEVRPLREVLAEAEKTEILRAIAAAGGVKLNAAKLLHISRAQLYEKLATHGLLADAADKRQAV